MSIKAALSAVCAMLVLGVAPSRVWAQSAQSSLKSPVLIAPVEPRYPPEISAPADAEVLLVLKIDAQGAVTEATVEMTPDPAFDAHAREAALTLRFQPAQREGLSVPAKIRYRMVFHAPAVDAGVDVTPPPTTANAGAIEVVRGADAGIVSEPFKGAKPAEVTVRGTATESQKLQRSTDAVRVVELGHAKKESADLGEVMARTQGVSLRRAGGLGSMTRFSLNGLTDNQIRFFLDGVPLELAGFPLGLANVPVTILERVEVYRGVVPIRFGADALGGAVNLVSSNDRYLTGLSASYQVGSFGTHRASIDGRYRDRATGFVVGATGFLDVTKNNYSIDVEIPDLSGKPKPTTVTRFHDAYLAAGGSLEVGVVDKPWAKRLIVRPFISYLYKELQNNPVMTVPYGEPWYAEADYGGTLRYEQPLSPDVDVSIVASYSHRQLRFVDLSSWVYGWQGQRIRQRSPIGETRINGSDAAYGQRAFFGRGNLEWRIRPEHIARANFTTLFGSMRGQDKTFNDPTARDPLSARRDLFRLVGGLEYELNAFQIEGNPDTSPQQRDYRIKNTVFAKLYVYDARSEEVLLGTQFSPLVRQTQTVGAGDGLRIPLTSWLVGKASYEYAVRLPNPAEVFGDGVLIFPSLNLTPEFSNNGNVGLGLELPRTQVGSLTVDLNGFVRDSQNLIVLLGDDTSFKYQNVYRARSIGIESALAYISPGRWVAADGNFTYQDQRNTSDYGLFADYAGDRIPNRPFLFGSWGLRGRIAHLPGPDDTLEPFYVGRYVHEFYRTWESQGLPDFKQVVSSQVTHTVGISYNISLKWSRLSIAFEVQNLTDAAVYDSFGVQRPGRSFSFKVTDTI